MFSALVLAWTVFAWKSPSPPRWLPRLTLALLCLRLAVPIVSLASEVTYQALLAKDYETSEAQLESINVRDTKTKNQSTEHWCDRFLQNVDPRKRMEALKSQVEGWIEHIVRLAAVFIVQTIVLPVLFLWLMLQLYRSVATALFGKHQYSGGKRMTM